MLSFPQSSGEVFEPGLHGNASLPSLLANGTSELALEELLLRRALPAPITASG